MRLKSEIWVKAYLRRLNGELIPAAVVRRGDSDAGAIFIKVNSRDGQARVLAPAPGGMDSAAPGIDRRWTPAFAGSAVAETEADGFLAKQARYDPDIWVIELEDPKGRHFLDDYLARG
jgi:hypothetical protein